jgi:hypothetical protein
MNNIVEVLGLGPLLDAAGVRAHHGDFEKLYSNLVTGGDHPDVVAEIERAVFDYFAGLELPDEPTLYDHLVLSLREKDTIATFNWDPFLVEAMDRNDNSMPLPQNLFMHGNVAIGHCMEHTPAALGRRDRNCHRCGRPLKQSRLLFPAHKDYSDPFIDNNWKLLRRAMGRAYVVTVFGYSAPATDAEAVDSLIRAWGGPTRRKLEEFEIIDIKGEDELYRVWKQFIHSHHYCTSTSFYKSIIGSSPRRSCEAMWRQLMEARFIESNPIPQNASWAELMAWCQLLLEDEEQT